jgi:hypothetical protein
MNNTTTVSSSSGKKSKFKRTGNPGKFIVQLMRRRTPPNSDQTNPTIITESSWQVVKAVPGTWLTAVAKYGLNWKDEDLHRVYYDEWVQKCEPGSDDTKAEYTFWETFEPGGKYEDGIFEPPKEAGYRDKEIDVDSYWCFKLSEIAEFTMPDMEDNEILKKRKRIFDNLFQEAFTLEKKKMLLDKLNEFEETAKEINRIQLKEAEWYEKNAKLLQDLKEEIQKNAFDERRVFVDSLLEPFVKGLKEKMAFDENKERIVIKEIEYFKFRCAQYDMIHEKDQEVTKIQKGTDEEDQWKKHPDDLVLTEE